MACRKGGASPAAAFRSRNAAASASLTALKLQERVDEPKNCAASAPMSTARSTVLPMPPAADMCAPIIIPLPPPDLMIRTWIL